MKQSEKNAAKILMLALLGLFCVVVTWLIGVPLLRLVEEPEAFQKWMASIGILGRIVFVALVIIQVLVAFIPGEPIELAAGYAFGTWEGYFLAMLGIFIGSFLIFLFVRKFGIAFVELLFPKNKIQELSFLKNSKKVNTLALILMTIPGTPKDFLSYFAGLTRLKLGKWLLIVLISRTPSVLTSTITGAAAGEERYLLSAIMLAISASISIGGGIYYRHICKTEKEKTTT